MGLDTCLSLVRELEKRRAGALLEGQVIDVTERQAPCTEINVCF